MAWKIIQVLWRLRACGGGGGEVARAEGGEKTFMNSCDGVRTRTERFMRSYRVIRGAEGWKTIDTGGSNKPEETTLFKIIIICSNLLFCNFECFNSLLHLFPFTLQSSDISRSCSSSLLLDLIIFWVEHPPGRFTSTFIWNLQEFLMKGEIVSDGVL